ncbi:MAG: protein translocase subunit SecD, partial [Candidatus Dadabacteria bacterium]
MSLKGRVYIFLATLIFAVILLLPTLFPAKFKGVNWISRPLSLGLDLKGGVYILYRVETDEAVKNRLQSILSSLRAEFRKKKIAATKLTALPGGKVELRFVGPSSASKAKEIIRELAPALQPLKEATSLSAKNSNTLFYVLPETAQNKIKREAVRDAVETLRRRVDQFGVAEPLIQPVGTDRILLQMPGVQDIEEVKKVIGSVAKLEFRLIPTPETPSYNQIELKTKSGSPIMVEDEVLMTGDAVEDARVSFTRTGEVEVSLTLTREGAEIFRNITSANVGRQLAIILDGIVYSHPVIREPIAGGRASITGGFTAAEAHALAVVLRAGALPAPLTALEERTVGPTLGKESIKRGALAITLSFALVMLFIAFYYKKAGLVTVGILITNLIFVLGLLS